MCEYTDWMDYADGMEEYKEDTNIVYCTECGHTMTAIVDNHYGADIDGNRGVRMEWYECPNCG